MILKFISLSRVSESNEYLECSEKQNAKVRKIPTCCNVAALNDSICGAIVCTTLNKTIKLQFIRGRLIELYIFQIACCVRASTSN